MLEPITTAEAFAKVRSALGMTQAELAAAIGLHPQTVSNYERGARSIDRRTSWAVLGLYLAKTRARARKRDGGPV